MKIKTILLSLALFSLVFLSNVKAWDPVSHCYMAETFLDTTSNMVSNLCRNYRREFLAGALEPDISIAYYYIEGGKVYRVFHNWNFYDMLETLATSDAEHCYAYGIALSHYVPDSYSHNFWLPDSIRQWKNQNWYWHPIQEGRVAASIIKEKPEVYERCRHALDIMFENPRLIEITEQAAGTNLPFDVADQTKSLQTALGTAWIDVYKPSEDNWLGKYMWPGIATVISTLSDHEDAKPYFEKSSVLMNCMGNDMSLYSTCNSEMCPLYPHGFDALNEANAEVYSSTILIFLAIIGGILLLVFGRKRIKKMMR